MSIDSKIRAGMAVILFAAFNQAAQAGYDVHITRAKEWAESEKAPVSAAEWIQLARGDGEFRVVQPEDPKETPQDAIWICPDDQREIYFYYSAGEIVVKNPDALVIAKMRQVARKLKARVVGDEGEEI